MTRPICLVTGATGAIGPGIVDALSNGHDIRTLSRRPPPAGLFKPAVTNVVGDISDTDAVHRAAEGVTLIVHLAALLHIVDPLATLQAAYERINVGGTAAVVAAAQSHGVGRVLVLSTIAVYGRTGGAMVDEATPPNPETMYGETKLRAERLALSARRSDGHPLATVLRSAAVYGPRVKGNYQRLVQALARRRFVPVGPGHNRRTVVFEGDLASAVAMAAADSGAAGRIYNVTDGGTHTMREMIGAICAALGRRAPSWHLPVAPVRAAVGLGAIVNGRARRALETYLEDVAVKGSRIEAELGFTPRVDLGQGWIRTIAAMRDEGLI
jgi:UDP-glucose 4-epimerase